MKKQSKGMNTKRIAIRVSPSLDERIRKRADAKEKTVSAYVRDVVVDDIEKAEGAAYEPPTVVCEKKFVLKKKG